ncbi:hypothetical protein [Halanaerobium kushneri]|jgi:hypothetical protein|nr:hypothetical protein [Halanaerobium kushneri]
MKNLQITGYDLGMNTDGGVGSFVCAILSKSGYNVTAATGKK